MKLALTLATLSALAGPVVMGVAPARGAMLVTDPHVYPVTSNHRVRLEFPVGELKVLATDEPHVRFDLRVRCRRWSDERCAEMADRLILDSDDTGGTLNLKLHKFPHWNNHGMTVIGTLSVPRTLAVDIEMGVGELTISGIEGDLDVQLGVGEADIRALRSRAGHVTVDTGIGDADIHGGGSGTRSRGFIGSHAVWDEGQGRASVRLHVGVGDASVRLE
ncbi:MAG TPA: hypothetical protein VN896_03455 [Methylomirabilota bacterium]|nr:hypothetical protein [Methylomirabilota bacterium]